MHIMWLVEARAGESSEKTGGVPPISLRIDGREQPVENRSEFAVPITAHTLALGFTPDPGRRKRFRLEGVDPAWREGPGEMCLNIRFANASGEQIDHVSYRIAGQSAGWTGDLESPVFSPRREALVVPPQASVFWVELSSAGPPQTLGEWLVKDLKVNRAGANGAEETLLRGPQGRTVDTRFPNLPSPQGFIADGPRPGMAQLLTLTRAGGGMSEDCLAIIDDDPDSHAEWHTIKQEGPQVVPGESLTVSWNQAYSVGYGFRVEEPYFLPPSGSYRFSVQSLDLFGRPVGEVNSLVIRVLSPWWKRPWVWALGLPAIVGGLVAVTRYVEQQRLGKQLAHLKEERLLEQERLRIARDIHDTLAQGFTGVIVQLEAAEDAQLRGLAQESTSHLRRARELARDSLQEARRSVRALRPQALTHQHLCAALRELVEKMTAGTALEARFRVEGKAPGMPPSCEENVLRICQEVLTNTLRHAGAKHFDCVLAFESSGVHLRLSDDGRGFDPAIASEGFGLLGIKERVREMKGELTVHTVPGEGTVIDVRLPAAPTSLPA